MRGPDEPQTPTLASDILIFSPYHSYIGRSRPMWFSHTIISDKYRSHDLHTQYSKAEFTFPA
jgi:hypothetical protein